VSESPSIVVIEDDASIGKLLHQTLAASGFRVTVRTTGASGLLAVEQDGADLVVLDLGLPDVDGIEVLRRLRDVAATPVVVLTARTDESDRILGLELGADDYVDKPFSPRELTARVRAVLRRSRPDPRPTGVLEAGEVVLDPARHEVAVAGERVELTSTEFDLLEFLLRHAGTVCRRELLLEEVWGYHPSSATRTVDVHVGQLRRKLGSAAAVTTVRGVGYRLDP
jgi:DNA-binding response OmpR family regulator